MPKIQIPHLSINEKIFLVNTEKIGTASKQPLVDGSCFIKALIPREHSRIPQQRQSGPSNNYLRRLYRLPVL